MMKSTITKSSAKGLRPYQEDRMVASYILDGYLLAVADGHGGDQVSHLVDRQIESLWTETSDDGLTPTDRLIKLVDSLSRLSLPYSAGSTLSVVWVPDNEPTAYVAVLGDSPVVIGTKQNDKTVLNIGPDHNVRSNPAEAKAVEDRGGVIAGGYACVSYSGPGLQMARALGDAQLHSILSRTPDVYSVPLTEKSFILVASDGVFDPGHGNTENEIHEVVDLIENHNADAKGIVQRAVNKRTGDNATAILMRFEPNELKN